MRRPRRTCAGSASTASLPPTLDTLLRAAPRAPRRGALREPRDHARPAAVGRPGRQPGAGRRRRAGPATASTRTARSGPVLRELGFDVSRRHGHVYTARSTATAPSSTTWCWSSTGCRPTATRAAGGGSDVGLGDAFRDPVPVVGGPPRAVGLRYEITEVRDDGWSFRHDRAGTFTGIEVSTRCRSTSPRSRPRTPRCPRRRTASSPGSWWSSAATRAVSTPSAAACTTASLPAGPRPRPS